MKSILNYAVELFDESGEDAMLTYLNRLVMTGVIDDDAAGEIAYMAGREE